VMTNACSSCLAPVPSCSIAQCLGTLTCGTIAPGGACEKLDKCCDGAAAEVQMSCRSGIQAARIGGDPSCQALLAGLANNDAAASFFSCPP
jgi:hypothetical protein